MGLIGVRVWLVALTVLFAGCTADSDSSAGRGHSSSSSAALQPSQDWKTASFSGAVSLQYPTGWHVAYYSGVGSSVVAPLIAISDLPIGHASSWPSAASPSFSSGAVSVTVSDVGNDGAPFHPNTTVDGRRAQLDVNSPAVGCRNQLAADESISGLIVRNSGNFIGLAACLPKARPDSSSDTVVAIFHSILTS